MTIRRAQSLLEEIYYHRIKPERGFRVMRVYDYETALGRGADVPRPRLRARAARLPHGLGSARLRAVLPERDGGPAAVCGPSSTTPTMNGPFRWQYQQPAFLTTTSTASGRRRRPRPACSTCSTRPAGRCSRACPCRAGPIWTPRSGRRARRCLSGGRCRRSRGRASCSSCASGWSCAQEDLARSVTIEMGKTIADARAEVARMIEMVEAACAIPTTMQGRILEDVSRNIDAETIRQPVGVCAAIVPFNFPAMVPFWFLPFAIACGNTFVLEAVRAGAVDAADRVRGVARAGAAPGRREPGQRGSGGRGGDPGSPGDRRGLVRRVGAGGADRVRAGGQGGQAGAGARAARRTTWS